MGLGSLHELAGHPVCGPSCECFCTDNLMAAAHPHCTAYFYRTHAGAEIGLLIDMASRQSLTGTTPLNWSIQRQKPNPKCTFW